jgi:hypothetical protein
MGVSKYEFRPIGTLQYIGGVCGLDSAEEAARDTLFGLFESHACKFGCSVQTYIVSVIFQL